MLRAMFCAAPVCGRALPEMFWTRLAIWFTTTPDLTAEFPAAAARQLGWGDVPLMCAHEMAVPGSNPRSLARCIRVLLLVNTDVPASAMRFVYLRGTEKLRVTA